MLKFLYNQAGAEAGTLTPLNNATETGYDINAVIAGPRAEMTRGVNSGSVYSTAYHNYTNTTLAIDHFVMARADKLLSKGGQNLFLYSKNSGGTWAPDVNLSPVTASDLVGIQVGTQTHGQDYVREYTPAEAHGHGPAVQVVSPTEAVQFSKAYFCTAFNLGSSPDIRTAPEWELFDKTTFFRPYRSTMEYEVEARIDLTWRAVTRAKLDSFRAIPQILNWPIFLYDADGDLWDWKLENVLVERWTETFIEPDVWDLDVSFLRLKHYE